MNVPSIPCQGIKSAYVRIVERDNRCETLSMARTEGATVILEVSYNEGTHREHKQQIFQH